MSDVHDIDLTVPLKKRRRALAARCHLRLEGHTRSLLLFNFHLGLAGFERAIQLRRFLADDMLAHSHHETAVVAAGDFNDVWESLGRKLMLPAGFHAASGHVNTFPAFRPMRALDWVYYRGDVKLLHCFASHTKIARQASDHLPMIAEFEVK